VLDGELIRGREEISTPDGRFFVLAGSCPDDQRFRLVSPDGSVVEVWLGDGANQVFSAHRSTDGSRVLIVAPLARWVVAADGNGEPRLLMDEVRFGAPRGGWSPNREYVAAWAWPALGWCD
jgi:hypothetical protein